MSIKIENIEVFGWEAAIRGMRNPKNSWDRIDSEYVYNDAGIGAGELDFVIGPNDHKLAMTLSGAGPVHGKFMRMIHVQMDITSNHTFWAEFDTYKVGTVRNSCSKMHRIHVKPFEWDDFSHEGCEQVDYAKAELERVIETCEKLRQDFNRTQDRVYWRALIELLPLGYNLTATVDLTYEVLANMYMYRRNHKVFEWRILCEVIESLPHSEFITCRVNGASDNNETGTSTN